MKVLNVLCSGSAGGIESLCRSISMSKCKYENHWMFVYQGGIIADSMKEQTKDNIIILNEKKNIIKIILNIRNYCKKKKIDIVAFHHSGLHNDILYIISRFVLPKVKFVRHQHICYSTNNSLKDKLYDIIMNIEFKLSHLIIFVSEASKKSYEEKFNLKNNKKAIVYNGIGQEFYSNHENKEKENILIYVGRLEKEKGVLLLLEAFKKFNKKNKKFKLIYIGDGSARKELEQLVKKYHLEDKVEFLGKKLNISKWLDISKIFVYPSICEESFGISVVEAMARGCIPVTFRKGGIPEIIENAHNGFIVEEVNSLALCNKLIEIVENCDYETITKNAFTTSKKFTIENTISELEKNYLNLIK